MVTSRRASTDVHAARSARRASPPPEPGETRRTEIVLEVPDRPGVLASIGEVLGQSGVNIVAAAVVGHEGRGFVHLVVDDASSAMLALKRAGFSVTTSREVYVVSLEDKPGELGRFARKLANEGLNISSLYVAGERLGEKLLIVAMERGP